MLASFNCLRTIINRQHVLVELKLEVFNFRTHAVTATVPWYKNNLHTFNNIAMPAWSYLNIIGNDDDQHKSEATNAVFHGPPDGQPRAHRRYDWKKGTYKLPIANQARINEYTAHVIAFQLSELEPIQYIIVCFWRYSFSYIVSNSIKLYKFIAFNNLSKCIEEKQSGPSRAIESKLEFFSSKKVLLCVIYSIICLEKKDL